MRVGGAEIGIGLTPGYYVNMSGFNPASLSDHTMHLESDSGVSTDVDGVYEWLDQSVAGNDATQTTGSQKPAILTAAQNGLNLIAFDGVDDRLLFPAITLSGPFTYACVFKYRGGVWHLGQHDSSGSAFYISGAGAMNLRAASVDTAITSTGVFSSGTAYELIVFRDASSNVYVHVNGVDESIGATKSTTPTFSGFPVYSTSESNTEFGEQHIWKADHSASLSDIQSHLNGKWAVY